MDPGTAYEHWQRGEVDFLDVREPSEWALGHIEGALWIPLGQLAARRGELDGKKKLVCVCRSGHRSNYAAALLRQAGIDAVNMKGGMRGWKASALPITPPGIVG